MPGEKFAQPLDEYLADTRLSNSSIELWRKDRADYVARVIDREPWPAPNDEMKFGSYFEALLFDEDAARSKYVRAPARPDDPEKVIHRASKEYKEFARSVAGRSIITPNHYVLVDEMLARCHEHPIARRLIKRGRGVDQLAMRWTCPVSGLEWKGRPDRVLELPNAPFDVIMDLKTDRDPRDTDERRRRWNERGYHRKMGCYIEGWREITGRNAVGFIVAVSNTRPVRCCVYRYEPDSPAVMTGQWENHEAAKEIKEAMVSGFWGYREEIEAVEGSIPPWAVSEAAFQEGNENE